MNPTSLPPFEVVCEQFYPLIHRTLNKYRIRWEREEYMQVGRIALWEAYRNYDPGRGPFAALAVPYVEGRILHALKRQYRLPQVPFSSFQQDDEERAIDWPDPLAEQAFNRCEWEELLETLTEGLSEREQIVVREHLVQGIPMTELAQRYGVSGDTVKTWKKRALRKMRGKVEKICPPLGR